MFGQAFLNDQENEVQDCAVGGAVAPLCFRLRSQKVTTQQILLVGSGPGGTVLLQIGLHQHRFKRGTRV